MKTKTISCFGSRVQAPFHTHTEATQNVVSFKIHCRNTCLQCHIWKHVFTFVSPHTALFLFFSLCLLLFSLCFSPFPAHTEPLYPTLFLNPSSSLPLSLSLLLSLTVKLFSFFLSFFHSFDFSSLSCSCSVLSLDHFILSLSPLSLFHSDCFSFG